ncbi:Afadin and alpha-actinin-binding-domain-containing protein [Cercophora scortea]|uniref:Afadin and alpha-actinin-binding-domain-containing protein n=1 Tax=Cercophora scortea TaxID=314031 RepID=A0AAE0MD91_9PEZI|nr:Afadin and alpha-actinin-binding-domain-containing protein [Cercophora scortea]
MTTGFDNLRTASLYINNQLLSRGLLRDGQTIDFTRPGETDGEVAATMGRVIAVVNDLILRRDRDAEHRESLSTSLRTLRAESLRQANDIQRLQDKHVEAQRKVALSQSAETTMQAQLRTAEATIQRMKDEAARTKMLVAQTRSACTNEVRKRDRQIDGLKKAVSDAGRARGTSKSPGVMSISILGEISPSAETTPQQDATADGAYDLRMETNSFLAELAKGLSEENETLLALIRRTTEQLKQMSGWEKEDDGRDLAFDGHAMALPTNCAEMAAEIAGILEHLRTILTNPSFVPIEEVVVREDEIHRLRHGWEKMESRWQEAVHLIDGWRKRMQVSGRPVNMEELKMGLRLSPVRVQHIEETAQGLPIGLRLSAVPEEAEEASGMRSPSPAGSLHLVPEAGHEDLDDSDCASSIFEDDVDIDDFDVEEPNIEILHQSIMMESPPLPIPPQLTPLRETSAAGNRGLPGGNVNLRKRLAEMAAVVEDSSREFRDEAPLPPPHAEMPQQSPRKRPMQAAGPTQGEGSSAPPTPTETCASVSSLDSVRLVKPDESTSKTSAASAKSGGRASPPTAKQLNEERAAGAGSSKQPPSKQPERRAPARGTATTTSTSTTRTKARLRQAEPEPLVVKPSRKPATATVRKTSATYKVPTTSSSIAVVDSPSSTKSSTKTNTTKPAPSSAATSTTTTTSTTSTAPKPTTDPMPPPPLPPPSTRDRDRERDRDSPETSTSSNANANPNASPNRSPRRGVNSRLPLLRTANLLPPPAQSPLNMAAIAAKLAASERDADAARVRAKLKAARLGSGAGAGAATNKTESLAPTPTSAVTGSDSEAAFAAEFRSTRRRSRLAGDGDDEEDELAGAPPPVPIHAPTTRKKRERQTGSRVASRRRSTLNPWELETLMQGNVDVPVTTGATGDVPS